ncbi:kinetochore-associated Ndc80 complex subunit nuf2 [Phytophthora boehmeriae]|uniref:Kinetochore-associated Ndc80 complex subunit nuf2 n=1 Tax=Phytophthora boehmeriae TaxID=109152 RepID=A0A8T1X861_9STRA|nr:kinetochore-associated Ndc80 complex subunit nuf2 [Phytophthora boehmeriae]
MVGAANAAAPTGVYSFPLLKPREIFACLREMRVPVAEDEIRACDVGAIRKVLEAFIESTMGVTREDMAQIAFPGLPTLGYPELHSESVPELTFYRTAQRLLAACGVDDFGLRDVLHPTPKRVRRQLSALINFAKFREERMAVFSEITNQTDELLTKKKALQEENAALERELQQMLEEQKLEEPARLELQKEVDELEGQINVLNKKQAVMRHQTAELKEKRKEVEDAVTSARFNKIEAEAEIKRLQGQIVTSPDRVKGELKTIAETLEKAKDQLHELEEKQRGVREFIDVYEKAEKEFARIFTVLKEAEQEMQSCKEAKNQVKDTKQRIADLQQRIAETITRRQRLEKILELKKREFDRYTEESRVHDQAANEILQKARDELRKLEGAHHDVRQRITQNSEASREIELKMKEDELRYQKELHDIQQMYTRLHEASKYYNEQVLDAIRSTS